MFREKIILAALFIPFGITTSCAQNEAPGEQTETAAKEKLVTKNASVHPYGGWYCPDNLGGFPPVNVRELNKVPVVNGRMPTEEETRNGTSLMYFDPAEYPTVKPVNMKLPKLARYYSDITNQTELVIIIQAVIVDADTVVGFRYLNGGNGTSWYKEVSFLSDKEVTDLGTTPFVFIEAEINAPKAKIWEAFAKTEYAKNLAKRFKKEAFFASEWTNHSRTDLNYNIVGESAKGTIMSLFGNLYLQIDYNYNGRQSVEKILVMENEDGKSSKIQIVFGPYADDYGSEQTRWENLLEEIKTKSAKK